MLIGHVRINLFVFVKEEKKKKRRKNLVIFAGAFNLEIGHSNSVIFPLG
jgi:hypothetical protein